jgi:hypothetical protein
VGKKLQEPGLESYKLQITNYKQIPNPKLQITNPSLETEYKGYNGARSQLAKEEAKKLGNEEEKRRKEKGKWYRWEMPLCSMVR